MGGEGEVVGCQGWLQMDTVGVRHTLACATQPQHEHVLLDRLEPVQLVVPLNKEFGQCLQIKLLVSIYSIHGNPCY